MASELYLNLEGTGVSNIQRTVTGLPFQPKALITWSSGGTVTDGRTLDLKGGIGIATGLSFQRFAGVYGRNFSSATTHCQSRIGERIFAVLTASGGSAIDARNSRLDGFTADGFQHTMFGGTLSNFNFNFLALGGTNCEVQGGDITVDTGAGDIVTALSFTPDFIIFIKSSSGSATLSLQNDCRLGFGLCDGSDVYSSYLYRTHGVSPTLANGRGGAESNSSAFIYLNSTGGAYMDLGCSIQENQFTITKNLAPSSNEIVCYLAVKGWQTQFGSVLCDEAANATKAVSGLAFQPQGLLTFGDYLASSIIGQTGNRFTFGGQTLADAAGTSPGVSPYHAASVCWNGFDAAGVTHDSGYLEVEAAFIARGPASTDQPAERWQVESYQSDGFTLENIGPKDTSLLPNTEAFFMAMIEGSNNNGVSPDDEDPRQKCFSEFKFSFGEYGLIGDSSVDTPVCASSCCIKLLDTPGTTAQVEFDLRADYADFFRRADNLILEGVGVMMQRSPSIDVLIEADNNSSFSSPLTQNVTITSADLVGASALDVVIPITISNLQRYWRVTLTTSVAGLPLLKSIYLGRSLRLDREPAVPARIRFDELGGETREARRTVEIEYRGIPGWQKQRLNQMLTLVGYHVPVYLWDSADNVLLGERIFKGKLINHRFTPESGGETYEAEFTFENAF